MSINRHNYEEYFILYLDNELDAAGRLMVEEFVQQHPDLREELDILRQFKLEPDQQIVFEGKEELFKQNGETPVTLSNYEEWFTAHVDRELRPEQEAQLEHFMTAHPHTRAELAIWMQTRITPEEIVFPGKSSLYKKEEKARRIFPLYFRAAAAVLLLLLATATVILLNRKADPDQPDVVLTQPGQNVPGTEQKSIPALPAPEKETRGENSIPSRESLAQTPVVPADPHLKTEAAPLQKSLAKVSPDNLKRPATNDTRGNRPEKKEEAVLAQQAIQPSNNLPQPSYNPNVLKNPAPENAIAAHTVKPDPASTNNILHPVVTSAPGQPSDIVQASYTDETELEQTDGKKNKNRGIFRKIARTFEKRTSIDPTDDNRLLVAGLSIKLK